MYLNMFFVKLQHILPGFTMYVVDAAVDEKFFQLGRRSLQFLAVFEMNKVLKIRGNVIILD